MNQNLERKSAENRFAFFSQTEFYSSFINKTTTAIIFLFLFFSAQTLIAAPSDIDFSFGSKVVDGAIIKSVIQPDGKVLLVGSFETFTDQPTVGIIRLNADGTRDASFDLTYQKTLFQGYPSDIILQPDGKILAFGSFYYGGDRFNYQGIVRLNSNGTRDTTFTSRLDNQGISSVALLPDGKILIGGNFQRYDGQVLSGVARINSDGTLDPTFVNPVLDDNNFGYYVIRIILQPDGKIFIAGRFDTVGGQPRKNAARLNADGTLDASFQNPLITENGLFAVRTAALQPDGKFIIGGSFYSVAGQSRQIARLNADGSLDSSFQNTPFTGLSAQAVSINLVLLQSDGKVYVEGEFGTVGGANRNRRARLNSNGTLDTTFNLDAVRGIQNIALQTNGRLITIGNIVAPPIKGGDVDFFYVREIALDGLVNTIVLQPDKKILIGGEFTSVGGQSIGGVARINSDGTVDTTFGNTGAGANAVVIQPDGKIVIGDNFGYVNGRKQPYISRLLGTPVAVGQKAQFDFDGDGKSDLSVFRSGVWFINRSLLGFLGVQFGVAIDNLAPADYDGDGKTDIAVWRENVDGNRAYFYIINSLTNTVRIEQFGITGDRLTGGDWDNDGKADLSVYRDSAVGTQSYFYYKPSAQANVNFVSIPWGATGDQPTRGDFDGDGKADAAIFRPSSGTWIINQSLNGQIIYTQFGISSDKLVPADYDGDGKTDIAVYRDGTWIILQSLTNQVRYQQWGVATDTLVPADYDGDGKTDVAVYRNGTYFILQSSNFSIAYLYFGVAGDVPVASAYIQ